MNGVIFFRADHELIGRVIAEKLRRRTVMAQNDSSFHVLPKNLNVAAATLSKGNPYDV